MTQIELMRDVLIKATFSRSAVETALADAKRLHDEVAMAALPVYLDRGEPQEIAVRYALEAADSYMRQRK